MITITKVQYLPTSIGKYRALQARTSVDDYLV